ncbi:uncharacterized protein LOC119078265 [Bradysia coprophila]|uniref:uncharacterized protein LOC119078265 n=1 Tax=Bradysia coprophila TaxID=38358 RepID=UPI00187DBBA4|nr:uncharacterized protein LOC119078265 [Bradysia coprophila]
MNSNSSTRRCSKDNIRVRMLLDKKFDRDSSSSSDSEFSDSYDSRLDDDFNAMLKQTKIIKNIKEEQLSVLDPDDMEINELLQNCEAVVKHEYSDRQQETTDNTQQSNITAIENVIKPESSFRNMSPGNDDENYQYMNDETITASQLYEENELHESEGPVEMLAAPLPTEEDGVTPDNSLLSEYDEYGEYSLVDSPPSIFHSTARLSRMPEELVLDDSSWTDFESDVTDTNFTRSMN